MGGISINEWTIALFALIAEGSGLALGMLIFYIFNVKSNRVIGMLFGGTSGLMTAIICFDVLPEALQHKRLDLVIAGVVIGILVGLLLDDFTEQLEKKLHIKQSKMLNTAIVLMVGIAVHNVAEGFAFGTIGATQKDTIDKFALVLALHSIPEGIALAIPCKTAKIRLFQVLGAAYILGSIMGIGALLGYRLSTISHNFITLALGLTAGIILYIVCEELIPESRKMWNGRMTAVATIMGIVFGMLLLY